MWTWAFIITQVPISFLLPIVHPVNKYSRFAPGSNYWNIISSIVINLRLIMFSLSCSCVILVGTRWCRQHGTTTLHEADKVDSGQFSFTAYETGNLHCVQDSITTYTYDLGFDSVLNLKRKEHRIDSFYFLECVYKVATAFVGLFYMYSM